MSNYFLGGTSASGFQTKFHEVIGAPGYFTYILKGGPGTGKSTLMKKVAAHFGDSEIDRYFCSSDIHSLDAVVLHDKRVILVDGTAPHVFNAERPGIAQVLLDLGMNWERGKLLKQESSIRSAAFENARYHRRAKSFAAALSALSGSIYDQAKDRLIPAELAGIVNGMTDYLPESAFRGGSGHCRYRQLAAITSEGYVTQPAPKGMRIFGILDPFFAAGSLILQLLKRLLLDMGQEILVSESVLFPKNRIEHITVPAINLRFSLLTPLNRLKAAADLDCSILYAFADGEEEELSGATETMLSLEQETAYCIGKALLIHDELEKYYISALDFKALDRITENLIREIEERPQHTV